jgi:hypothetical protein
VTVESCQLCRSLPAGQPGKQAETRHLRPRMKHAYNPGLGVAFALALAGQAFAATSPDMTAVDRGVDHGLLGARDDLSVSTRAPAKPAVSSNPLWAIPLSTLTATRERPLFSPTRRPPAAAIAVNPPPLAPPPAVAEHPDLTLVGTVTGQSPALAVFIDTVTHNAVRLRTGEAHRGWILQAVDVKSAKLHKDRATEMLTLPVPAGGTSSTPIVSALPPPPPAPVSGVVPQPVGTGGEPGKAAPQSGGCMPEPVGC